MLELYSISQDLPTPPVSSFLCLLWLNEPLTYNVTITSQLTFPCHKHTVRHFAMAILTLMLPHCQFVCTASYSRYHWRLKHEKIGIRPCR